MSLPLVVLNDRGSDRRMDRNNTKCMSLFHGGSVKTQTTEHVQIQGWYHKNFGTTNSSPAAVSKIQQLENSYEQRHILYKEQEQ